MPAWGPGTQGGKPVDVAYSIPITFELQPWYVHSYNIEMRAPQGPFFIS
jgi:hypothetical protein